MTECDLCPTLFELAHKHANTWIRFGLFHGTGDGTEHDACQIEIVRDAETITGIGRTWQQAMRDLGMKINR